MCLVRLRFVSVVLVFAYVCVRFVSVCLFLVLVCVIICGVYMYGCVFMSVWCLRVFLIVV